MDMSCIMRAQMEGNDVTLAAKSCAVFLASFAACSAPICSMWEGQVEIAIHTSLWSNWRKYGVLSETFAVARASSSRRPGIRK